MAARFSLIYDALGQRVTACCMAYSTYMDFDGPGLQVLCCKACCHPVPIGQGDGTEFRPGVDPDAYYEEHFRRQRWEEAISHATRKETPCKA